MLTVASLAVHDDSFATPPPVLPSPSSPSSPNSSQLSSPSSSSSSRVGVPRSGLAVGTDRAYDSVEKWILAALRSLSKGPSHLLLKDHEPNDALASEVHSRLAKWYVGKVPAKDAGVEDDRLHELSKPPPQDILIKSRGWMLRYLNAERAKRRKPVLPNDWGRSLADRRASAREVNTAARTQKAEAGTLYHHKHDLAPTIDQLTQMVLVAFTGDDRVDVDVVASCEAGAALGLYLPTGARGSELRKMHLQTLGYERLEDEDSGLVFEFLKLTAFECKTKDQHLMQILPHVNPWRCGVGAFGTSLLVRVASKGPPPFTMQRDENSWKLLDTAEGKSFDRRLKDVFKVAGVRRQLDDPLTYLGRHLGTRLLQHKGGTSEGGAMRRGHTSGSASHHYTEVPLPDMLRLASNTPSQPFIPAHLQPTLYPFADAVLDEIFPDLSLQERLVRTRHRDVDCMRGHQERVRSREQLNDQLKIVSAIRLVCRVSLLCLVARPRAWQKRHIQTDAQSLFEQWTQQKARNRVLDTIFPSFVPPSMHKLSKAVQESETNELDARKLDPNQQITSQLVAALGDVRESLRLENERTKDSLRESLRSEFQPKEKEINEGGKEETEPDAESKRDKVTTSVVDALESATLKRKPVTQGDVAYVSSWATVKEAVEYARNVLAPREREEGPAWRIRKLDDGREDKSRDRQYRFYRTLCAGVAKDGLHVIEARHSKCPSMTALLKLTASDLKDHSPEQVEAWVNSGMDTSSTR